MIEKERFVEILKKIEISNKMIDEINSTIRKNRDIIETDFLDGAGLFISHEDSVIELLENMFDTDLISWWVYDLECGKKYAEGCLLDKDNNPLDVSTAEKVYDHLISELPVKNL